MKFLMWICYYLGRISRRFRVWYYEKAGGGLLWGIRCFIVDVTKNGSTEAQGSFTEEDLKKLIDDIIHEGQGNLF